jgi:hypothetical protein
MSALRSWALAILSATFPATVMAAGNARDEEAQRPRYKPEPHDFVIVCTLFNGRAPGASDSTPTVHSGIAVSLLTTDCLGRLLSGEPLCVPAHSQS